MAVMRLQNLLPLVLIGQCLLASAYTAPASPVPHDGNEIPFTLADAAQLESQGKQGFFCKSTPGGMQRGHCNSSDLVPQIEPDRSSSLIFWSCCCQLFLFERRGRLVILISWYTVLI